MLGKRKATAAALEVGKKPNNHGGKRRGAGSKLTPTNAPGSDAPSAPKRTQATLSDLLGARREAQKKTTETEAVVAVVSASPVTVHRGSGYSVLPQSVAVLCYCNSQ